jgi:outer membrane protein assembly factor BamB
MSLVDKLLTSLSYFWKNTAHRLLKSSVKTTSGVVWLVSAMILIITSTPASASSPPPAWVGWGNGQGGTHFAAGDTLISAANVEHLQQSWAYQPCLYRPGLPSVANNLVIIPSCLGTTAINITTDETVWTNPDVSASAVPTMVGSRIFFPTEIGTFVALSLATGHVLWTVKIPSDAASAATALGSYLVLSDGPKVIELDQANGVRKWTYTASDSLSSQSATSQDLSSPVVSGSSTYLVSSWYVFSLTDKGKLAWTAPINNADGYSSWDPSGFSDPLVEGKMVYAWAMAGNGGAELEGISLSGPSIPYNPADPGACYAVWCLNGSWASGDLAMENGILFATFNNDLSAYRGTTGSLVWNGPENWGEPGLSIANGIVFSSGGAYSANAGKLLWTNPDGCATPITIYGANLLCGTGDGYGNLVDLGIGSVPTFTSSATVSMAAGSAQTFEITTAGSPTPPRPTTITLKGSLPTGVKFSSRANGTAFISGTPKCAKSGCPSSKNYVVTLNAAEGNFQATQTLTITVDG